MRKVIRKYFVFSVSQRIENQYRPMITSINSSDIGGGKIIPGQISEFLEAKKPTVPTGILIIGEEKSSKELTTSFIKKFPGVEVSVLDPSSGLSKESIINKLRKSMPREDIIAELIMRKITGHDFQLFGGGIDIPLIGKKVSTGAHAIYQAVLAYGENKDFGALRGAIEKTVGQKISGGFGFFNYRYDSTAQLYRDILKILKDSPASAASSAGPRQ